MEPAQQLSALEHARALASANIFEERASTGNALVTLQGLKSKPHLNGAVATIVASGIAPHAPSAGRMAVRLADENIIAVKFENARPTVPIGTRVAINSELQGARGGGFVVDAEFGEVSEVTDGSGVLAVRVDGALRQAARPRPVPLSWATETLVLEVDFRKLATHVAAAAGFERHFTTVSDTAEAADARRAALVGLRECAAAAQQWRRLENHAQCVKLAALNELQALRRLGGAHVAMGEPGRVLAVRDEARALLAERFLWEQFPAPLLPSLYQERARLCLLQASVLVESPELRGADEGHAEVGALLSSAAQDAVFARDEPLGRAVLVQQARSLVHFARPADLIATGGARASSAATADGVVPSEGEGGSEMPARQAGAALLEQIDAAERLLQRAGGGQGGEGAARAQLELEQMRVAGETLRGWLGVMGSWTPPAEDLKCGVCA